MNTELLQFLDGTLAPEQEAELLHRLSVSPERRELLRSYFNQQQLFQRDRNSIAVPYAAEQKLWASLGAMMPPVVQNAAVPAAAVLETAATTASRTGVFNSAFSVASVAVICLLIGLGSGFFVGKNQVAENFPVGRTLIQSATMSEPSERGNISPMGRKTPISNQRNNHSLGELQNSSLAIPGAPPENETIANVNTNVTNSDLEIIKAKEEQANTFADISAVSPKQIADDAVNIQYVHDPSQYSLRSPFDLEESTTQPQKSFIQKFEFYFNEGIGKQFPNNAATNVSMPVVTNSSISALWQGLANTPGVFSHLWIGGSFGTANVTMKKFRIAQKDPLDPKAGYEMVGDLTHVQTTYLGGLLQYRIPLSKKLAFTMAGEAAGSSAGLILGGELGLHLDMTNEAGFVCGVRGTHLSYNVDAQQQQVIAQGITSFGVTAAAQTTQPSYNVEFTGGLYFHF